jgi:rod shape determining protein RodA
MKMTLIKGLKTLRRSNWLMTLPVIMLLVAGVLFVYSSCYVSDDQAVRPLYERQIVWMVAGLSTYVMLALYDFRRFKRIAGWAYGMALALLVAVLFIGRTIYGAKRWLMLFGENGIGIQPSEIAKLTMIVLLAHRLSESGRNLSAPREVATVLALIALPVALIMKQPDLGTALVFVPTAFIMMFVAGVPFRYLGSLAGVGITMVALLLAALFLPARFDASEETQARIQGLTGLSDYQRGRIEVFFHPDKDPLGAGWNKRQSEIAVGSGGLWGKGYLHGTQNILGFLPRSVAPTDFIYSVIAEEEGFFGSLMVLALFGVVLMFGMMTALRTRDAMGRLLCVGVVSLVFCHVFINIAMTVGLMPITGLPLPLLSYGGSFMVIMMSALGIIQSVHIRSHRRDAFR